MAQEIERKFLVLDDSYKHEAFSHSHIEQGYICTSPVIRVRRADDKYILTVKGEGLMSREEHELPLTEETYLRLRDKADGIILTKRRFLIPLSDIADNLSDELSLRNTHIYQVLAVNL